MSELGADRSIQRSPPAPAQDGLNSGLLSRQIFSSRQNFPGREKAQEARRGEAATERSAPILGAAASRPPERRAFSPNVPCCERAEVPQPLDRAPGKLRKPTKFSLRKKAQAAQKEFLFERFVPLRGLHSLVSSGSQPFRRVPSESASISVHLRLEGFACDSLTVEMIPNPNGVNDNLDSCSQGSSFLATAGLTAR